MSNASLGNPEAYRSTTELLLTCARVRIGLQRRERIRSLCNGVIDWDQLVRKGERHAVVPLLYRALAEEDQVPRQVRKELFRLYTRRAASNLFLTNQLHVLLDQFQNAGIPVFVHKGLPLAMWAYDDLTLRHVGDLDLVIQKSDLPRASRLLESAGFLANRETPDERGYHLGFHRENPEGKVELHWAFTSARWPFPIPEELLWSRVVFVPVAGRAVPCLEPEMAILALIAHGTKEGWERLGLIVDLAEILDRFRGLRWDWILEQARLLRRERAVLLGIALAASLLNAEIPPPLHELIVRDRAIHSLCRLVQGWIHTGRPAKGLFFHFYMWRVMDNTADRAVYFSHVVPTITSKVVSLLRAEPSAADYSAARVAGLPPFLSYWVRLQRIVHGCGGPWLVFKTVLRRLG